MREFCFPFRFGHRIVPSPAWPSDDRRATVRGVYAAIPEHGI
jgi:hypothetical protein